jgi:hypothetical protein
MDRLFEVARVQKMKYYIQALLVRLACLPGSGDPCDRLSVFNSDIF